MTIKGEPNNKFNPKNVPITENLSLLESDDKIVLLLMGECGEHLEEELDPVQAAALRNSLTTWINTRRTRLQRRDDSKRGQARLRLEAAAHNNEDNSTEQRDPS